MFQASKKVFCGNEDVKLGEKVLVGGFPYGDILGGYINVTSGIVSGKSRSYSGSEEDFFQTDAALQPGNSGGPVYDKSGNIIGIVVGQLDKLRVARTTGSIPENTNFAIKASVIRKFLTDSGFPPRSSSKKSSLRTEELASIAEIQTVLILCYPRT